MIDIRTIPLPALPVGATFCSGIGAPEIACPEIDWRLASEIAPFPRAILAARFGFAPPEAHNQGARLLWGDMATLTPADWTSRGVPLPDVVVAGTPCQSFSIAGDRGGLADARGNLTLKYVELCHALQDAKPDRRLFTIWENVRGVLSDRTNAFGCLLAGIVGGDAPLHTPDGRSWPRVGMVAGPRGRAAWRVLGAEHFGVPQRRARVFLVASLGDGPDPSAILFERQGGDGHPATRGETETENARGVPGRAGVCGVTGDHARTLTANGFDASEDGSGRGRPIVAVTSSGDIAHCLNAGGMGRCDLETETMVAFTSRDFGADAHPHLAPTLCAGSHMTSHANAGCPPAIAVTSGETFVRRLTPVECHRLQGFPDDHCAIEVRGKVARDGPQYKALGNSMAVPVMRWILMRAIGQGVWS